MKSNKTRIIESIEKALRGIREGARIPGALNGGYTFSTSPRTVTRRLSEVSSSSYPLIIIADPTVSYKNLLSDVQLCTLRVWISGALYDYDDKSIALLDQMSDDVRMVLTADPQWGGLARRSRLMSWDGSTEIEEPSAAFVFFYEVDFVECLDVASESTVISPLPVGQSGMYLAESISNSLYNAFASIGGIASVSGADVWPVPPEQITRRQCPGVWFQEQDETFQYTASDHALKLLNVSILHVDVDTDPRTFGSSVDRASARIKNVVGKYGDLDGLVTNIDLRSIRTNRSEFPVILADADITIRYYQSVEES